VLERQNVHLQEQATELELQQEQLQAAELEMQKEEIQTSADELAIRTEAAEAANRAKSDFLATMSQDGWTRVHVADTGRGIPMSRQREIFEPFVQVDRHLTPDGDQGIGLGLATSRELARAMNGELTVESEEGRGARSTVSLRAV